MNTATAPAKASGQCAAILKVLNHNKGSWTPMPTLVEASGSYAIATRISDLRKLGYRIVNQTENKHGMKHSYYQLL